MKNINFIYIKKIKNINGTLSVFEKYKKFKIKRIFTITANKNSTRGKHAHKRCNQIFLVPKGKVEINLNDGIKNKKIILSDKTNALHVGPMIWAKQKFLTSGSVLIVICDQNYLESDYIRKYQNFVKKKIK